MNDMRYRIEGRPDLMEEYEHGLDFEVEPGHEGGVATLSLTAAKDPAAKEDTPVHPMYWMRLTAEEARTVGRYLIALADAGDVIKESHRRK